METNNVLLMGKVKHHVLINGNGCAIKDVQLGIVYMMYCCSCGAEALTSAWLELLSAGDLVIILC